MQRILLLLLLVTMTHLAKAQSRLDNASFEGDPQDATVPTGWHACEIGSTPDILPGPWQVYLEASEGETYMGLITREDGSWENVGQRLKQPMKANECYKFSLDLAHSRNYAGYNHPIKLRVWGGRKRCGKVQLLGETKVIDHQDWRSYEFEFTTKFKCNYIIFEAWFGDDTYQPIRGNILIDGITRIETCTRA
ncbi:MAG: hypothetical protein AAFO94_03585 [Bacteroidota bacterium]